MPGIRPDQDRTVIPRWRTFSATLSLGELDSSAPVPVTPKTAEDFLHPRLLEWQRHHSVGHAADLVGAALAVEREDLVAAAATFLLQHHREVSPWALELAQRALRKRDEPGEAADLARPTTVKELRLRAKDYRSWLRAEPRDSIAWVDLARLYATMGARTHAARCMTIASQLAPDNRFVLRAGTRLWVHLDDPERAHDVVARRVGTTSPDPWLLAAEIAACRAARRPQKRVKVAQRLLGAGQTGRALSELASALATLELEAGAIRKSRRLFGRSLECPTENSIAQAAWASTRDVGIELHSRYLDYANAFEARSWMYMKRADWDRGVQECWNWMRDQPFSSRPSVHGSYVTAVVLQKYEESESFADVGLTANPSDFVLRNNLAFACANAGKVNKARKVLAKIAPTELGNEQRAVFLATSGLVAFRAGDAERGRRLYADSLRLARKVEKEIPGLYALAATFYAIEEVRAGSPERLEALEQAQRALRDVRGPVVEVLEGRLRSIREQSAG